MKSSLKTLYILSVAFIFLSFLPYRLKAAPVVSISLDRDTILVNKTFVFDLSISWEGDAELYVVDRPHITLPESIEEKGSSFSTTSKEGYYSLHYKYNLCVKKEGEYTIKPIEISYWEKGNNKEEKVKTEVLKFQVTSFSILNLNKYWLPAVLITIFLSLFITLIVLRKKRKRVNDDQRSDDTVKETIVRELDKCNTYKLQGDWGNFLKTAISIRNKFPAGDKGGKIMEELDMLAERTTYGGFHPTPEEINLIQRQLEKAFKNAFPNNKDRELDKIKFR